MNQFFDQILMTAFKQAYQQDVNNLIAFQALMSQANPPNPPHRNVLMSFLFGIFQKLVTMLPEVGSEVGWVLSLASNGIQMSTNDAGQKYYDDIEWKQFLEVQALSYSTVYNELTNGLWDYTTAYWKHYEISSVVKKTGSKSYKHLVNLVNVEWENFPTQTQTFRTMIADFMNSCHSGIQLLCYQDSFTWGISNVNNGQQLTSQLMNLTAGCLNPADNLRDRQGHPVQQSIWTTHCTEPPRSVCRQGPAVGFTDQSSLPLYSSDHVYPTLSNGEFNCENINENYSMSVQANFGVLRTPISNNTSF
eukprot:CAMPEP_0201554690 /NCGR_PEP_ID=MMETSP0173_2-20130828/43277_1 /ASSEMBLY_ACC=CAM_ASM_000268 /TAXON_ID=218659 /ORGANISM="Vexillifera sp., Strain DIVA3 564/2" /LENGTH=304 /DNA_ID=CAMNT_0047966089 /DNA_START=332 /DNA_END=1246 /DNA_ORIENTATION=-